MQERSGATCHMAMPQCCYLAKEAKHFFELVQPKFIFGLVNSRLNDLCYLFEKTTFVSISSFLEFHNFEKETGLFGAKITPGTSYLDMNCICLCFQMNFQSSFEYVIPRTTSVPRWQSSDSNHHISTKRY